MLQRNVSSYWRRKDRGMVSWTLDTRNFVRRGAKATCGPRESAFKTYSHESSTAAIIQNSSSIILDRSKIYMWMQDVENWNFSRIYEFSLAQNDPKYDPWKRRSVHDIRSPFLYIEIVHENEQGGGREGHAVTMRPCRARNFHKSLTSDTRVFNRPPIMRGSIIIRIDDPVM